ncbi:MAG: hypothetical protein H0V70_04435 [Ktedonobacteraceae bacterium]|nr:hypothetical protein [Ktedonobacteraceae bacterium]
MKLYPLDPPLLLIVDSAPTFPLIVSVILRRAGCPVEVVAFQTPELAIFWLSGTMDEKKATKYPLGSPWDAYPPLRRPAIAIVSLHFPPDERDLVMDWLYVHSRRTKIITTATEEEMQAVGDDRDELYWRCVVAHLPRPARDTDVITHVTAALAS